MTEDRWRRIEEIFHGALEQAPEERAGYIAAACGTDSGLRKEVESLLAKDPSSPDLVFNNPTVDLPHSAINRLETGARLGPYEIESRIGAGGMAEVWKARDTRLGRPVALKISRTDFSRRFEQEARTVAALNHPHICTLYDVGPNYLVMEFINGKPLQEVIPGKGLPLSDALNYAGQIADALAAAHTAGIVHRDLKPGNIMVTEGNVVKVVDFGLARVVMPEFSKPSDPNPLTARGEIVGTVSYMSPEQAEGKNIDARSDVFSFGAVLYEMLTGARAFHGTSLASTLADIIHIDPRPASEIAGPLPRDLETLLARCLRKDPSRRWQTMADVRVALLDLKEDSAARRAIAPPAPASGPFRNLASLRSLPWILAGIAVVALAVLAGYLFRRQPVERAVLRYTLPLPAKTSELRDFVVSPNGHYLAIDAAEQGAGTMIWVRALDSLDAQPLAGTEDAMYPFWSPDSRWIAFFSHDKLKKIAASGGPVQTLCDAPTARGGTWNRAGTILFAGDNGVNGLSRVRDAGGPTALVTKVEAGTHRWPWFLPDGIHFLYMAGRGPNNGIHLASLGPEAALKDKRLTTDESRPSYAAPSAGQRDGFLLFVRERTLMAQPVNPKTFEPEGELFPVAEQVSRGYDYGTALYSLSENGILVYQKGRSSEARQYTWFDRTGKEVGRVGNSMRSLNSFAISPDRKRFVLERPSDSGSGTDLWLADIARGTESRFTFDPSLNSGPVWSPDGTRIAFESNRGDGTARVYQRRTNNMGADELLWENKTGVAAQDWSPDGKYIIFRPVRGPMDLWALPLSGDRKPIRLVASPSAAETLTMGQVSPDGHWLAYATNASGLFQVMVQPFAPAFEKPLAAKWQISTGGGAQPRWRGDGKELFYMAPDGKLMAVEVNTSVESFEHGTPHALFASPADAPTGPMSWSYVPSPDGARFLIRTPATPSESPSLTVIVNWPASADPKSLSTNP